MKKYRVEVSKCRHWATDPDPRVLWCHKNIPRASLWECQGWIKPIFSFRREQDAIWFALRWKE